MEETEASDFVEIVLNVPPPVSQSVLILLVSMSLLLRSAVCKLTEGFRDGNMELPLRSNSHIVALSVEWAGGLVGRQTPFSSFS